MLAATVPAHRRRTSFYTLTVPAPEHADADLNAAADALVQALAEATGMPACGSAFTRGPAPTISVSYRVTDDETATTVARSTLAAYGFAQPSEDTQVPGLHTGYGVHRRDFLVA